MNFNLMDPRLLALAAAVIVIVAVRKLDPAKSRSRASATTEPVL